MRRHRKLPGGCTARRLTYCPTTSAVAKGSKDSRGTIIVSHGGWWRSPRPLHSFRSPTAPPCVQDRSFGA